MRWLTLLALVVGCTKPNPLDCSDNGTCSDPARPFCDVDGALGGVPNSCIAVDCEPGSIGGCRDSSALICSADGTNYDVGICDLGCRPDAGCFECTNDSDCGDASPICNLETNACEACVSDEQCDSGVCSSGSCLTPDRIVYASPTGAASGPCLQSSPCELSVAVTLARTETLRSTVKLAPGEYRSRLLVPSGDVTVVGYGAVIVGDPAVFDRVLAVSGTGKASFRGVTFDLTTRESAECNGTVGQQKPELVFDHVTVLSNGDRGNTTYLSNCKAVLTDSLFLETISSQSVLIVNNNIDLIVERTRFESRTQTVSYVALGGVSMDVRVMNSLFPNVALVIGNDDDGTTISRITMAFSSIFGGVFEETGPTGATVHMVTTFENNIIASNATNSVDTTFSKFQNNIIFPQTKAMPGNLIVDPVFVNAQGGDLHIGPTSPAIDAAGGMLPVPSVDFDGTPRPQGAKADIGAYERLP